jgi:hypothetical protein
VAVEQSTSEVPELPNTCGGVQEGVLHLAVECGVLKIENRPLIQDIAQHSVKNQHTRLFEN